MKFLSAVVAGLLFGSGLLLSGMANPELVLAFLDLGGAWNPALAFVMAGAIAVAAPAYYFVRRRSLSRTGESPSPPANDRIDRPLVSGAAIFGIGWGLTGICPGPGLILLTGTSLQAAVFVTFMAAGMLLAPFVRRWAGVIESRSAQACVSD
jgi:uncharacterized membrane protein YedE/YeeE